MNVQRIEPPRKFKPRPDSILEVAHVANVSLAPGDQLSFITDSGTELDVLRTDWGYVATPSMNRRLRNHGLRAVLVRNDQDRLYLLLVEEGQESNFEEYLRSDEQTVVCWLDNDEAVQSVVDALEQ